MISPAPSGNRFSQEAVWRQRAFARQALDAWGTRMVSVVRLCRGWLRAGSFAARRDRLPGMFGVLRVNARSGVAVTRPRWSSNEMTTPMPDGEFVNRV